MVKPNALFSSRLVFGVYSICWAYHDQKIITLPSALKERQSRGKSKNQVSSKFVLRLHFAICLAILFFFSPPFTVVPDFCVKEKKAFWRRQWHIISKKCHFYLKCRRCLWWQCVCSFAGSSFFRCSHLSFLLIVAMLTLYPRLVISRLCNYWVSSGSLSSIFLPLFKFFFLFRPSDPKSGTAFDRGDGLSRRLWTILNYSSQSIHGLISAAKKWTRLRNHTYFFFHGTQDAITEINF